jgi:hypothetical protein
VRDDEGGATALDQAVHRSREPSLPGGDKARSRSRREAAEITEPKTGASSGLKARATKLPRRDGWISRGEFPNPVFSSLACSPHRRSRRRRLSTVFEVPQSGRAVLRD